MAPIYFDGHDKSLGLEKPVRVEERVFRFATVLREEKNRGSVCLPQGRDVDSERLNCRFNLA